MVTPAMGWPPTMTCRDRKRWPTAQITHLLRDHLGVATRRRGCKAVGGSRAQPLNEERAYKVVTVGGGHQGEDAAWHGQRGEVARDDLSR